MLLVTSKNIKKVPASSNTGFSRKGLNSDVLVFGVRGANFAILVSSSAKAAKTGQIAQVGPPGGGGVWGVDF
jgi:hypothetical protein